MDVWHGMQLRLRRVARGWSQTELAERLGGGVRADNVSHWERGLEPPPDTRKALSRILGVPVATFYRRPEIA